MKPPISLESIKRKSKKMPSGCIHFTGCICKTSGYGKIWLNGVTLNAHRAVWILTKGPIPKGLFVCHACDNRKCINIDHLWLGTHRENVKDMIDKGRQVPRGGYKKTHCAHGHRLTPKNLSRVSTRPGHRICKLCRRIDYQTKQLIKKLPL